MVGKGKCPVCGELKIETMVSYKAEKVRNDEKIRSVKIMFLAEILVEVKTVSC
jgi:hypothetical protein